MESYTPKIIKGTSYVEMLIQGEECCLCHKIMISKLEYGYGVYPKYFKLGQEAQMKLGGLVYKTQTRVDDHSICHECNEGGKATFRCYLCGLDHTTDKIKETYGDPPEFLCVGCYEITPAKKWHEACEYLYNEHRFDHL